MENASNVSSEEELLTLRNEGKISEDQYRELLGAVRKAPAKEVQVSPAETSESRSIRKRGRFAFILMLLGPVVSVACFLALQKLQMSAPQNASVRVDLWFLPGLALEIAAFVAGILAWPNTFGKATVITISVFAVFAVLLLPLSFLQTIQRERIQIGMAKVQRAQKRTAAGPQSSTKLRSYPLDDTERLITESGVVIDKVISSDGNGSLRIDATRRTTVRLFETGDVDVENARLIYQAKVRTENVQGRVYLEMWCHFAGKGDFFSRGLMNPLTGTTSWTTLETPFLLKEGENPDNVKLNLVVAGKGTVWIDDIQLLKGMLQ
jgi:hypothetical protein